MTNARFIRQMKRYTPKTGGGPSRAARTRERLSRDLPLCEPVTDHDLPRPGEEASYRRSRSSSPCSHCSRPPRPRSRHTDGHCFDWSSLRENPALGLAVRCTGAARRES